MLILSGPAGAGALKVEGRDGGGLWTYRAVRHVPAGAPSLLVLEALGGDGSFWGGQIYGIGFEPLLHSRAGVMSSLPPPTLGN
jgi:hypothetical protein